MHCLDNRSEGGTKHTMKKISLILLLATALFFAFGAGAALADDASPLADLKTPAEASNWERTTSSQEVIDYCKVVAENSGGRIRLEFIGTTVQGNKIPLLVIGDKAPEKPADVSADKAIALINCNIHSGEIEGKESMLIFAREVALGQHDDLLKDLVILLIPNMNPDGNDDLGKHRINSQFTPKLVGTRTDGEGYNINRDMTKLDSTSGQAVVALMNEWDPVIFVDAHATNGSWMRHAITYNWGLHPNTDAELMAYNRDEFSELALGSKSYLRTKGKIAVPYGNFGQNYSGLVSEGWRTFEDYPRYTTNYAGLRNRLAILLEVYSYDPYKTRVDTQYECIYGILLAVQQEKDHIKKLIAAADARSEARATKGIDPNVDVVALNSELAILKEVNGGKLDVLSYTTGPDGKVAGTRLYDKEGDPYAMKFEGEAVHTIDYWGKFVPTGTEVMGAYYLVEADGKEGVALLQEHGVEVYQLKEDVTLAADKFQWYDATVLNRRSSYYEGHLMNRIEGSWKAPAAEQVFPAGTYVVSSAQSLGNLAALLLEPASVDGATSWNFFDDCLTDYDGTVRANYLSKPSDSHEIAIPIFKVSDFGAITAAQMKAAPQIVIEKVKMPFTDVKEADWFHSAADFVFQEGLFAGTDATTFSPQASMTRAMLSTVIWRIAGEPAPTAAASFSDVKADAYYADAAAWAAEKNILAGFGKVGVFEPNSVATREQLVSMLYQFANAAGYRIRNAAENLDQFSDGGNTSEWAVEAMKWAVGNDIIGGKGNGVLDPAGKLTRAEVAALIMRFVSVVRSST